MKFVRHLESILEKCIEGFFDKKFASDLEPVELAKLLARLMEQERSVSVAAIYAPNQYLVALHPEDYRRLDSCSPAISQEIAEYLMNIASRQGFTLVDAVTVSFSASATTPLGCPVLSSSFSRSLDLSSTPPVSGDTLSRPLVKPPISPLSLVSSGQHTQVFGKVAPHQVSAPEPVGKLTVTAGSDAGKMVSAGWRRINMGRRETNELALTDLNTSRLHAYLAFEEGNHVLYDAKSLNGTYVNGHRITRIVLKSGDQIKLGNTLLVYEVR